MAKNPQTEKGKKPSDKQAADSLTKEATGKPKQEAAVTEPSKKQKIDQVPSEPVGEAAADAKADSDEDKTTKDTTAEGGAEHTDTADEPSKEQKTDPVPSEPVGEAAADAKADSDEDKTTKDTTAEGGADHTDTADEPSKEQKTDPVASEPVGEPAADAEAGSDEDKTTKDTMTEGGAEHTDTAAGPSKEQKTDPVTGEPVGEPEVESEEKKASNPDQSDAGTSHEDDKQTASPGDDTEQGLLARAGLPDVDVVKSYLSRIYQATHGGEESFESILAEMPSTVLDYLEANNELLDQSMHAQNDEELKALFDAMSGTGGPAITPAEMNVEVPLTEQSVAFLMRQWAWSSIEISSKVAKEVLGDREVARLYSQAGVPMLIKAGNDKEQPCISFTMLGGKGFDEKLSNIEVLDSDVEGDATGALDGKIDIMRACVDMLVLAQSDKTVIKQGLREAQRNLWALSKVFDKATEGFDPTDEDEKWLSKRSRHLQETFSADMQAAPTHTATKQLGGTGRAREEDEETK